MAGLFESGEMSMKKLLVLIALGTVLAAPAFAQHDPNRRGRTSDPQRPSTVPPGGIYYYERNGNANPHHHLGGSKSKRTPTKHARRHASVSPK
jgi:hypothetical protein